MGITVITKTVPAMVEDTQPQENLVKTDKGELSTLIKSFHKTYGPNIGGKGVALRPVKRIATGIFPLDLALGGGFPRSRICIVYGAEGSGKTNLALLACVHVQNYCAVCDTHKSTCNCSDGPTIHKAVFVDIEHTFDSTWALQIGVDITELVLLQPDSAEQAADIVEAVIHANDVGIIVVDSIAALTTSSMIDGSTEKAEVGGSALIISKMVKKVTMALSSESKRKHHPLILCINQTRVKIGVMHGNPETTPGGNALRFASSMTVRINGKELFVKDISDVLPAFKETSVIVKKWKVPIVAKNTEYNLCVLAHNEKPVGWVDDWNTVSNYLNSYGLLTKHEKSGYMCISPTGELEHYSTLKSIRQKYDAEVSFNTFLKSILIKNELKAKGVSEGGE